MYSLDLDDQDVDYLLSVLVYLRDDAFSKVRPEMSENMTFLEIASAEKKEKIPFLASTM